MTEEDQTRFAGGFAATDPRLLLERGWREDDDRWESLFETALDRWLAGDAEAAKRDWSEALMLARRSFGPGDARLAASLTASAFAKRAAGDKDVAESQLHEALLVWDRTLAADNESDPMAGDPMAGERRARSSMYHFSLESRFAGGYDRHVEARHRALVALGRDGSLAHLNGQAWTARLDEWRRERPAGPTFSRKLMAAAYLLPPNDGEAYLSTLKTRGA